MALTAQQEADLLSSLTHIRTGEQIDDLPAASMERHRQEDRHIRHQERRQSSAWT